VVKRSFFIILTLVHNVFFPFCTVYFTPRDDLKSLLIEFIKEERKSIDCAMYMFTEKTIAQEILQAYLRGVKVRILLDPISMDTKYGKGLFLKNNGMHICVFEPAFSNAYLEPIMHHKFFIFGHNQRLQRSLVWTGSYNCTSSASRLHEENVIITDEAGVIEEYKKCFSLMLVRFDKVRYWNDENENENE
jgi:phosphatidylserine/phosphatidylglycerophosphate/cardiolipin synthase-like enzyme